MRACIIALAFATAACAGVPGAPAALEQAPPAAAAAPLDYPIGIDLPAGAYRLDPRHASVLFRIRHQGLSWFVGRFDDREATLSFDPADPSRSQLSASVAAASVNAGVPGEQSFDREIAQALGADATPRISFVSTSIERTGQFTARINGDLTMNGQTHPATIEATFLAGRAVALRGGAVTLAFSGRATINRRQWGVTRWGPFADDEVQLQIEGEFVRS